jgi:rhodanese-related sulfurtransferase
VVAVLACDLVSPDPGALQATVRALRDSGADAAVPWVGGRAQWLHAAWRRSLAPVLESSFAAGERSVARAAGGIRLAEVPDLADRALRDADHPEDLPAAPRIDAVEIPAIDIDTLRERLDGGAPLVDVRQPEEYEEARAPGARLIPLAEVPDRLDEFPGDETVYVICRSGGRSGKAVEFLRGNGIDAVNVAGGTLAWIEAGNAVETGA